MDEEQLALVHHAIHQLELLRSTIIDNLTGKNDLPIRGQFLAQVDTPLGTLKRCIQ